MRKAFILASLAVILVASATYADLQNVQVGGRIDIRARNYMDTFSTGSGYGPAPVVRYGTTAATGTRPEVVGARPVGSPAGVVSVTDWDDIADWKFVEQLTEVYAKADFTDNVSAMIKFDEYSVWSTDFRSDYITGADTRASHGAGSTDVEILESYIDIDQFFGIEPLRVRVGRQQMKFGRGWLVDNRVAPTHPLAFDGIRATYTGDDYVVDGWWTKLAETSPANEDGDIDFYGLYGTYSGFNNINLSGYYMLLRDSTPITVAGDYDTTYLNTVGTHIWGNYNAFDYMVEAAYQFGDAEHIGALFGDDDAEFDNFGIDAELGYTLDDKFNTRLFIGGVWFQGEDNRDINASDIDALGNPVAGYSPDASVNFNRLFSGMNYCPALQDNAAGTNFIQARIGASANLTDKLTGTLRFQAVWADETFDLPLSADPAEAYLTDSADSFLGYSTCLVGKYRYSEDLMFIGYWGHLFTEDGTADGNYIYNNGTLFSGGTDDEDVDYVFLWAIINF